MKKLITSIILVAVIGGGMYFAYTSFLAPGMGLSPKEIVEYNKLESKTNDMGLNEMYYEGEPFTGYAIQAKMTLESGAVVNMGSEYQKGELIIGKEMFYFDSKGKQTQFNFNAVKDTEYFMEGM